MRHAARGGDQRGGCLFECHLKFSSYRTGCNEIKHGIFEPEGDLLNILAIPHHAAVEAENVISVIMCDCCEHLVLFGSPREYVLPSPTLGSSSTRQHLALSNSQNTVYISNCWRARQARYHRALKARGLVNHRHHDDRAVRVLN